MFDFEAEKYYKGVGRPHGSYSTNNSIKNLSLAT